MVDRFFLAVETSQDCGSLGLGHYNESRNFQMLALKEWSTDAVTRASHSESINQYTLDILQENKITLADLDLLIVDIGPGSFTGVRVGINFVRSLSYSFDIPVHPICALAVLAHREFLQNKNVAEGILPSLGTEFYYAQYQKLDGHWQELHKPQLKQQSSPYPRPAPWSANELAACAFTRPAAEHCEWKMLSPLYLRGSQAEEKMKRTTRE